MGLNKVILTGRIAGDLRINHVKDRMVVNFPFAYDVYKDESGFINAEYWLNKDNKIVDYLQKGSYLILDGSLKMDVYEKDGERRQSTVIYVNRLELAPKDPKYNTGSNKSAKKTAPADSSSSGDIPF